MSVEMGYEEHGHCPNCEKPANVWEVWSHDWLVCPHCSHKFTHGDLVCNQLDIDEKAFDHLIGVTLERMVSEGKLEMNLHNGEPHYRLPTKEPVQAVCFSAQPVANGSEVPELEDETFCEGCSYSRCFCDMMGIGW